MSEKKWWSGFSWKLQPGELAEQVDLYEDLIFYKSLRGQVVIFFLFVLLITAALTYTGNEYITYEDLLPGAMIYLLFLVFAYLGHVWAIYALIILWSADKIYTLAVSMTEQFGSPISSIIFWIIGLSLLVRSLQVEKARSNRGKNENLKEDKPSITKVGESQSTDFP